MIACSERSIVETELQRDPLAGRHAKRVARRLPCVPSSAGFTASTSPSTTYAMERVFRVAGAVPTPKSRRVFVSFSVKSSVGIAVTVQPAAAVLRLVEHTDRVPFAHAAAASSQRPPTTRCCGTRWSAARRWSPAPARGSMTWMRIRMSSASAFAYSTSTSK